MALLNRGKILEELELNKKLLKQGVVPTSNATPAPSPTIPNNIAQTSISPDLQSLNTSQRSAFNLALSQSFGYYIPQDSIFGNLVLPNVEVFSEPKIELEQYTTTPHLTSMVLHTIESRYGDISNKTVADLGSGCGILSIGAVLLGAGFVAGFEIDKDAIEIHQENIDDFEIDNIDLINCDVTKILTVNTFDTVIMNPPFGTRNNGIDSIFVEKGLQIGKVVYSMHKTSTRDYFIKKAKEWNAKSEVVAELRFNLPQTYKFHTKKSVDVEVDVIKFTNLNFL